MGGLNFTNPPTFSLGKNLGIELEASITHILNFSFVLESFYISSPFSDSVFHLFQILGIPCVLSRNFFSFLFILFFGWVGF